MSVFNAAATPGDNQHKPVAYYAIRRQNTLQNPLGQSYYFIKLATQAKRCQKYTTLNTASGLKLLQAHKNNDKFPWIRT